MLQLTKIKKSYTTGAFTQVALNDVSINFRQNEFAAILGTSGSGKTTLLNIIGGLDQYDSGDLTINGKSTKDFKAGEWDAYRNNSVGFIFQSYNLIAHLSILDNVEMGMTLSGVSSREKKARATDVLTRVGLQEHLAKKPSQLSGGQMQRVAIARALANDPDIILADEPTGALDTKTSEQIMDLIKEIAADKLVIMVTHNPDLAERYADRIINVRDGVVVADSNPDTEAQMPANYTLKRTSMSYATALKLSGKNIITKKWRTALTAFAASLGIIGIALILSLSNGFQTQIDNFQSNALAEFPITVSKQAVLLDEASLQESQGKQQKAGPDFPQTDGVTLFNPKESNVSHENNITQEYLDYIAKIDPQLARSIGYTRLVNLNLIRQTGDEVVPVKVGLGAASGNGPGGGMNGLGLSSYPEPLLKSEDSYLKKNYDVLAGAYPQNEQEMVLVVDKKNRVDTALLTQLGFATKDVTNMPFSQLVGTEFQLVKNDDYYSKTDLGNFVPATDLSPLINSPRNLTLKIAAVVRQKEDVQVAMLGSGIAYSDNLVTKVLEREQDSAIVKAQKDSDQNVLTMEKLTAAEKQTNLTYLGGDSTPLTIYIYPINFESKDKILAYLDAYNKGKANQDSIVYSDLASSLTALTGNIMSAITMVLIAFAAISLVVSLIMVGIITYISVLERTKEIGVLRALGARKKDITRVFNAETLIIGLCSGLLGIGIAYLLTIPTNIILEKLTGLAHVAQLNPLHALVLILISVTLTLLGGTIPARLAAKKDPVEALRSE